MFEIQFALKSVNNRQEAAALLADDCMETRVSDQADLGRTKPEKPRKQFSHAPLKKAKTFTKLPKTLVINQYFSNLQVISRIIFLVLHLKIYP